LFTGFKSSFNSYTSGTPVGISSSIISSSLIPSKNFTKARKLFP
ncbi:hypothetical protein NT05LI_2761a, partial [Listeria ivanovii FSL F6-596]